MDIQRILNDKLLKSEILDRVQSGTIPAPIGLTLSQAEVHESIERYSPGSPSRNFEVESIILRTGRPVLTIQNNTFQLPE